MSTASTGPDDGAGGVPVSTASTGPDDGATGLVVSGGGTVAVAVDELFVAAAALGAVAPVVDGWLARAGVLRRGLDLLDVDEPIAAIEAASPAWHTGVGCVRLEQSRDLALTMRSSLLDGVRAFNQYDLYSKSPERPDLARLRSYYEDLVAEWLPDELQW